MAVPDAVVDALGEFVPGEVTRGGVRLGDRAVRWVEAGSGQPTLVLEAGRMTRPSRGHWSLPRSPGGCMLVAYDRAGLGASYPAPSEDVVERQIADVAAVIGQAADGPCILAGHSWGGLLAKLVAFRHPGLVSGLVLVDPAHEQMTAALLRPACWVTRIRAAPVRSVLPLESAAGRPDELRGLTASLSAIRQLLAASHPFPDIPVTVLSATRGFPPRLRTHWTALQADLAAAPRGRHSYHSYR
ncbi:MAG: alpha/beta fold hydrolase [Micromonosporaceae bacterium]